MGAKLQNILNFDISFPIRILIFLLSTLGFSQVTLSTSDTQWQVPAGVTSVTVECWGAGGAGGSNIAARNGSGGGGGGAYSIKVISVTPDQIINVQVGSGGTVPGGAGGDSWFISSGTINAGGGIGGGDGSNGGSGTGGTGGTATGGDTNFNGGTGGDGNASKDGYGGGGGSSASPGGTGSPGGTATASSAGTGGGTGDGAGGDGGGIGTNGTPGSVTGGGGGGSGEISAGGAGADGKIVINYSIGPDCPLAPTITNSSPQFLCFGDATTTLITSDNTSGGTGTYAPLYQWYYNTLPGDANTISTATLIPGATNSTYTPPATIGTFYYFCVSYTADNGCGQTNADQSQASAEVVEVTISDPPTPANAGNDLTLCTSSTSLLANNPTIGTGTWSVVSGSATIAPGEDNLYNATVSALGPGANVLRWTITNGTCTPSTSDVTITNNEPTTPVAGTDQFICGTSTNLEGNTITAGTGEWSLISGTATFTEVNNPLMPVSNLGNGNNVFRWTATNGACILFDEVIINSQASAPATPSAPTGSIYEVGPGIEYQFSVAADPFATSYTWEIVPSGSGWSFSGTTNSNTVTLIGGNDGTAVQLRVEASNTCGNSGVSPLSNIITSTFLPPHENCNQCHITHNSLGSALTNLSGNSNLCLNCHNPVGTASAKPLENADKASNGGTSHSWDAPALNTAYETNLPTDSEMALRIVDVDLNGDQVIDVTNAIVCSTCHNQHNSSQGSPYMRVDNAGDALCKDCHSARDVGIYTADQANHKGSHPVGISYPTPGADPRFEDSPLNSALLLPGNNVECSTCHSVHDVTDSKNITTDGNILRVTNDVNLCKNCHNYQQHNGMDCLDCHTVHNTDKNNIMMIRSNINSPFTGSSEPVVFTSRGTNATPPGPDAGSFAGSAAPYTDGICEVCHDPATSFADVGGPNHAYNTTPDPANGNHYAGQKCTGCHTHGNPLGSFKAPEPGGGGECGSCHPVNGITGTMTSGSHEIHISRSDGLYAYMNNVNDPTMCNICHNDYGNFGNDTDALNAAHPEHNNGTVNVVFDPNGMANSLGRSAGASYTGSPGGTCNNVYCHSSGTSSSRGSMASGAGSDQWGAGPVSDTYYNQVWGSSTSTQNCDLCHPGGGDPIAGEYTAPYMIYASNTPSTGRPPSGAHEASPHSNADAVKFFYSVDGTGNTVVDNISELNSGDYVAYTTGWGSARGVNIQCFWCHNADAAPVNDTEGKLQGTYGTQWHLDGQTWFNPFNYRRSSPTTDPLNPPVDGGGVGLPGQGTMAPGINRASGTHCASGQSCW